MLVLFVAASFGGGPDHPHHHGHRYAAYSPYGIHEQFTTGSAGDVMYPYDQQDPWLHGYFQEIPAYGGYSAFLPYNYKHILSQRHAAQGWGLSPIMPYSHHWWNRYAAETDLRNVPRR